MFNLFLVKMNDQELVEFIVFYEFLLFIRKIINSFKWINSSSLLDSIIESWKGKIRFPNNVTMLFLSSIKGNDLLFEAISKIATWFSRYSYFPFILL